MPLDFRIETDSPMAGLRTRSGVETITEAVVLCDRDPASGETCLLLHRRPARDATNEVGFFVMEDLGLVEISPGPATSRAALARAWQVAAALELEPVRLSTGEASLCGDPGLQPEAGLDPDRFAARLAVARAAALEEGRVGETGLDRFLARLHPRTASPLSILNALPAPRRAQLLEEAGRALGLRRLPAPLRRDLQSGTPLAARCVELHFEDTLARIRLVRPQSLNAIDPEMLAELDAAWQQAENRPRTSSILLEAAGPAFMAGVDLPRILAWMEADRLDEIEAFVRSGHRFLRRVDQSRCHTLIALHGLTVGAGAEFSAAFDSVLATPQASIGFPELTLGIYPALGGTQRLPRRIGYPAARWWILGSRLLHAQRARQRGLVDLVVDPRQLEDAVRRTAGSAPLGTRAARHTVAAAHPDAPPVPEPDGGAARIAAELLESSRSLSLERGVEAEIRHLGRVFSTPEALDGIRRAVEGRGRSRAG